MVTATSHRFHPFHLEDFQQMPYKFQKNIKQEICKNRHQSLNSEFYECSMYNQIAMLSVHIIHNRLGQKARIV